MTIDEAILDSKKRAEEYAKHGYSRPLAKYYEQLAEWLEELKEYKELEEQGLLLRLPCKVGDILWHFEGKMKEPIPCEVKEFVVRIYRFNRIEIYFEDCTGFSVCDFNGNLDEGWYLTKEEAEQALEKARCKNVK